VYPNIVFNWRALAWCNPPNGFHHAAQCPLVIELYYYVNKGLVGCALRTHLFHSRGQPGGLVTFLASPRKVTQRRRPHSAALRFAAGSLRCSPSRAAAELALCAQTVLAEIPRLSCATRRQNKGVLNQAPHPHPGLPFLEGKGLTLYALHPLPPLRRLGLPKNLGVVGEDCLRP